MLNLSEVVIKSNIFKLKLKMLICDTPAKSFVLSTKGHSGYFSCHKCCVEGEFVNKTLCFPETKFDLRTDHTFRNRLQEEHHTGISCIENISNFDLIRGVPLDYMHLICLGIVKRLIVHNQYGWIYGKPPFKLPSNITSQISNLLISWQNLIPVEFVRKTRTLNEVKRWKATEFRLFLLYTGIVVLKGFLPKNQYYHFVTLHVVTSILLNDVLCEDPTFQNYSENL